MIDFNQLLPSLVIAKNEGLDQQKAMQVAMRSGLMAQAFGANQGMAVLLAKREAERVKATVTTPAPGRGDVVVAHPAETGNPSKSVNPFAPPADGVGDVVTGAQAAQETETGNPGVAHARGLLSEIQQQVESHRHAAQREAIDTAIVATIKKLAEDVDDCDSPAEQMVAMAEALAGDALVTEEASAAPKPKGGIKKGSGS